MRGLALGEERAQATVEMAVVTPVLIVLALIVYNVMSFTAASARFDRVAPDIVLAHGVSPAAAASDDGSGSEDMAAAVEANLQAAMEGCGVEIEVTREQDGSQANEDLLSFVAPLVTYRCVMRYRPWPSGLSIAGVDMGAPLALVHERPVTVDAWRSGVVV